MAEQEQQKGIAVKIVTPEGEIYDQTGAEIAVINTKGGQMGIMAGHEPVLAALAIDEMIVKKDDQKRSLAVNGGVAEFSHDLLTVIADSAEIADNIDVNRAENAKERAQSRLAHAQEVKDSREIAMAHVALMRAVNRIHVASIRSGQ
ncbi:F0F1 ATP synthase subunit epsilon [Fructobacillus fructosus]|jgi:F-type H+-transporting ATPase subunit epsilon|uniref:ATP synthase epsilon chain n=1 Tax=Fructobacillus fructosus TaxID=1631 RepID=A0ABM9MPW5_9LACO|nr:F0F1 ATP synthase subunit epsilon [Fructobacillus fructosus]MBD9365401.1 F0F1 ATP synthase subunit epsilon [Leuconostoc mesenteroides]KRN52445.1 F0F1 ATP synthase subunit epsilon [Fructobacillus fructosus KCTC 3544]MBC9118737.1 F0F1 ATP synthase subunit epsilon [Fructobacillus fructosus]MCK8637898.1 F0F1 ATP synthase subunit epsilon [Fructobacillus fructosus]CAK1231230.1 FoF1-type ATP synthase [Fructobacillus fructosus]